MKIIIFFVSFSILLISNSQANWVKNLFSNTISSNDLVERDNIIYDKKSAKKYTGKFEDKHENGKISRKGEYKDGIKHGLFEEFHNNGKIKNKRTFFLGQLEGIVESYHDNGILIKSYKTQKGNISDGLILSFSKENKINNLEFYRDNKEVLNYFSHNELIVVSDTRGWKRGEKFNKETLIYDLNVNGCHTLFDRNAIFKIGWSLSDITVFDEKSNEKFTGKFIYISNCKNDKIFGSIHWTLKSIIPFKDGKINGEMIILRDYYDSTRIEQYLDAVKGQINGQNIVYSYNAKNELDYSSKKTYKKNVENGFSELKTPFEHVLKSEGNYVDGAQHGQWTILCKDGKKILVEYDDGTPKGKFNCNAGKPFFSK